MNETTNNDRALWEDSLQKFRVLMKCGSYMIDESISTVCLLPDDMQMKFAEWCRGNVVCTSSIESEVKIKSSNSALAKSIFDDASRRTKYRLQSCESFIVIISPEEEAIIIAEDNEAVKEQENKRIAEEIKDLAKRLLDTVGESLMTSQEAEVFKENYNNIHNDGGHGFIPSVVTVEQVSSMKERLTELGVDVDLLIADRLRDLSNPKTTTVLKAYSHFGGFCLMRFTEDEFSVLSDCRKGKDGYLHVFEDSAVAITDRVRNVIIKYFYNHDRGLPGIGATPQDKYFKGLTREQLEDIGNGGAKGYYM